MRSRVVCPVRVALGEKFPGESLDASKVDRPIVELLD